MIENTKTKYQNPKPEQGEKELAELIKEAGETARTRTKQAMALHRKRLTEAISGNIHPTRKPGKPA